MGTTTKTESIRIQEIPDLTKNMEPNDKIIWERDGSHSTDDLQIILEFEKRGFQYKISNYEGKYEKNAIKVEFTCKETKEIQ